MVETGQAGIVVENAGIGFLVVRNAQEVELWKETLALMNVKMHTTTKPAQSKKPSVNFFPFLHSWVK